MATVHGTGERRAPAPSVAAWVAVVLGVGIVAAACGTSSPSGVPTTTSQPPTSTTTAPPMTTGPTTTTTAPSGGAFIPATAPVYEFYSPSRNISCEIDYGAIGSGTPTQSVLCLTISPPQSVVLSPDGSFTTCTGMDCLSNAGLDTPTLAYGDTTGAGPFRCRSATTGMTCTVTDGKGFRISSSGITPVGG